jgi:hypothetical protein
MNLCKKITINLYQILMSNQDIFVVARAKDGTSRYMIKQRNIERIFNEELESIYIVFFPYLQQKY